MAHITGGGITENLPRVLPTGAVAAVVELGSWPVPPIFRAPAARRATSRRTRCCAPSTWDMGMVLRGARRRKFKKAQSVLERCGEEGLHRRAAS